jgi:hypothetical protein
MGRVEQWIERPSAGVRFDSYRSYRSQIKFSVPAATEVGGEYKTDGSDNIEKINGDNTTVPP